jgi:hypothetical protein
LNTAYKIGIIFLLITTLMVVGCVGSNDDTNESTTANVDQTSISESRANSEHADDIIVQRPLNGDYITIDEELKAGTRQNPAQINDLVLFMSSNEPNILMIKDVVRGDRAGDWARNANQFNENPAYGYEYAFVNIFYYIPEDDTNPISLSIFDFKAFANGAQCESPFTVMPNHLNELSTGTVLPGGHKQGWVPFIVPANEEILITYSPLGTPECYISIGTYPTDGTTF